MADQVLELVGGLRLKLHDNGDGSFSVVTYGNGGAAATIAASENHIGQVGGYSPLIDVVPTLDTSAYSIGDVFFVATSIPAAMRANDKTGVLQTLYLIDKSDQAPALDLYFFDYNVAFGTINVAPSISDADALHYMGHESIAVADWKDLGANRVVQLKNLGKVIKPVTGAANIYVAAVIQTALTFGASDLLLRAGFLDD